ncbi:hypothetical protein ACQW02_12695 [Humitalea sp. 24SJ18S-53]|uniref:hypothetical protein n=1 Tax=Humitalea sp. 24SJ18S-53 TaxID=3422307 RepID=UPI003D678005
MTNRTALHAAQQQQARAAFLARKAAIDGLLARLMAASADHFGAAPDAVTWADEGTLGHVETRLAEIAAFLNI